MEIKINELNKINISPVNARMLNLELGGNQPNEIREQYVDFGRTFLTEKILALDFYGKKRISIGDILTVKNFNYNITSIEPGEDNNYYLLDDVFNKSAYYLLPLVVDDNRFASNYLVESCLYNTYMYYDKYPEYSNGKFLFLCYRFVDHDAYKRLENDILKQKSFIAILEPNNSFTVFVMKIDNSYTYTINLFLEGKYHYLHNETKDRILNFYHPNNNANSYHNTFNKVKKVLEYDINEIKRIEKELNITLPRNMSFESKPDINLETCKL